MLKTKSDPFFNGETKYTVPDVTVPWYACSDGQYPQAGDRKILVPYMGSVWLAAKDPMNPWWNIVGTSWRILSADLEHWMPLPEPPAEPEPHDAFTRKPRSMYTKEDIE